MATLTIKSLIKSPLTGSGLILPDLRLRIGKLLNRLGLTKKIEFSTPLSSPLGVLLLSILFHAWTGRNQALNSCDSSAVNFMKSEN